MEMYLSFIGEHWWQILLAAVIAYLLGSINTAVMVTSVVTKGKKDIREMGSGNAGFTNVLRSVGKVPAIITIVCDALKCVAGVLIGALIFSFIPADNEVIHQEIINVGKYIAGVCCILGHSYPIYFGFKGGKGVVTAAALMLTEDWRVFLFVFGTFALVFIITKIISASSITAAALYAPFTFLVVFVFDYLSNTGYTLDYVIFSTCAALLIGLFVIVKHKENIGRLIRGEEKKITAKKK